MVRWGLSYLVAKGAHANEWRRKLQRELNDAREELEERTRIMRVLSRHVLRAYRRAEALVDDNRDMR